MSHETIVSTPDSDSDMRDRSELDTAGQSLNQASELNTGDWI